MKVFSLFKHKQLSIQEADNCKEPPEISVTKILYNYNIHKHYFKILKNKKMILSLKIISIEDYEQEKYGKNSYKLKFSVQ